MIRFPAAGSAMGLALGVVSLLADATYEGARSVAGPYLAILGASAAAVSIVAGAGELLGYTLRLVSGYASDRARSPWTLAFAGYALNLLAVPCLALAGRWEVAAALLILERVGRALRTPVRDAMLSYGEADRSRARLRSSRSARSGGRGRRAVGRRPRPRVHRQPPGLLRGPPPSTSGRRNSWGHRPSRWSIALVMAVDAGAALLLGWAFDRLGIKVVAVAALLASPGVPLVFLGGTAAFSTRARSRPSSF